MSSSILPSNPTTTQRRQSWFESLFSFQEQQQSEEEGKKEVQQESEKKKDGSYATLWKEGGARRVLLILCILSTLSLGSTIGVVPAIMTTRYARLNHGFMVVSATCSSSTEEACRLGSADAQTAAAIVSLLNNLLTFFTSSLIGSLSDIYGRKPMILGGIVLSMIHPFLLVWMQVDENMSANWYYASSVLTGLISWFTIALSSISDVTPKHWRAPCFGMMIAAFSLGFALSPTLALTMSHFQVSLLSFFLQCLCFLYALLYLPETLSPEVALLRKQQQQQQQSYKDGNYCTNVIWRPVVELSILNRNSFIRTVALLAFFSGMSSSGDRTLLLYYVEDRMSFTDKDVAMLFMIMGIGGIILLGACLKPLNERLGEKNVVFISFFMGGFVHNTIYAFATTKFQIFIGIMFSVLTELSFPTLSAMKSNNVEEWEQGQIQGALYSVSSLASALGPAIMRLAYQYTTSQYYPYSPGNFFLVGSLFFLIASLLCTYSLPSNMANSKNNNNNNKNNTDKTEPETQMLLPTIEPPNNHPHNDTNYNSTIKNV